MKRSAATCLLTLLLLWGAPQLAAAQDLRAAAVVNDEVISVLDLEMRIRLAILSTGLTDTPDLRRRLLPQVLRALIDERIQSQEAARLGIQVTEAQIDNALDQIAQQNNMPRAAFMAVIESRGILPTTLRDQLRAQLLWQLLVSRRLRPSVLVTPEDVDEVVQRLTVRQGAIQRLVSEIFLSVDSAQQEAETRAAAERLFEQLKAGADFAALAREFSQSAAVVQGGDLGWVPEGRLAEDLESALARMSPGSITPPIRSLSGYHILYLRDLRRISPGDVSLNLKHVLIALPEGASEEQRKQAAARATEARDAVDGCTTVDEVAQSIGSPGSGDLGTVKLADLPMPVREAVATLRIGQASTPVPVPGGLSVLVLCDRQEHGIDRDRIEQQLVNEQLDMLARRFLRDLRRTANVDIRI